MTRPDSLPERFNLRDLGGLPLADGARVRSGRLFRGASLHRLEGADRELVDRLGFRLAIDLRTGSELEHGYYEGRLGSIRHLPIFEVSPVFEDPIDDVAGALAETYLWMLEEGPQSIATVFELLADSDSYPAVVYCAAGKDRTGVVCALVLRLLGAEPDRIAADYALSDGPTEALRRWRAELAPERRDPLPAGIYRAPKAAMGRFLEALDGRYGSVAGYLEQIGVEVDAAAAALRANLLAAPEPGDDRSPRP